MTGQIEPLKPARQTTPSRSKLINRMLRLLDRQIGHLESDEMASQGDKEVALLGNMVRSLEKLIELDNEEKARRPGRHSVRNIDDLREKLTERLDRLKRD